jgi:pyruvate dehydrogenase E2 component (dihydrolipoamide acetyltransferase)
LERGFTPADSVAVTIIIATTMIKRVLIPQAFENMEEATIGAWLKHEGEAVHEGEALCELITEKTTFDLPAEDVPTGEVLLRRIIAPQKSIVPVGYCIALLGEANDALPDVDGENVAVLERQSAGGSRQEAVVLESAISNSTPQVRSTPAAGSRVRATPAARRVAKERGVSIEEIAATLPGKVLTEEDVLNYSNE